MLQISMLVYVATTAALSMGYFELLYIVVGLLSRCRRTVRLAVAAEREEAAVVPASRLPALAASGWWASRA